MDQIKHKFYLINDQVFTTNTFKPEIINYGTTIYELIKIIDCTPLFLEKYLKRIQNSLKLIKKHDWINKKEIIEKIRFIIKKNQINSEDHLKILVSFNNPLVPQFSQFIAMFFTTVPLPSPEQYLTGVQTISLNAIRSMPNAKIYQPQLRQRTEKMIQSKKIYEVILLNNNNDITEGSRSNIFFIDRNNNLITPDLENVLPGITRDNVIEVAKKHNIKVIERKVNYNELQKFISAFLTGTSRKILPISTIDNYNFDSQNILLRNLMKWYDDYIYEYLDKHREQFADFC